MLKNVMNVLYNTGLYYGRPLLNEGNLGFVTAFRKCLHAKANNELKPEDTFGNYGRESEVEKEDDELNDGYLGKRQCVKNMQHYLSTHQYDKAKEEFMNIRKREKPPIYAYRILLSYSAWQGDVKEAFKLYNDFKKQGYFVHGRIYTSLFKACAHCKRADVALPIAKKLMGYILENKDFKVDILICNSIIKALGRHGDLVTAVKFFDTMKNLHVKQRKKTYNLLLQACIKDKASGLRHALFIWHKMLRRGIVPDIYAFLAITECTVSCSMGDFELIPEFLNHITQNTEMIKVPKLIQIPEESHELVESSVKELAVNTHDFIEGTDSEKKITSNMINGEKLDVSDAIVNDQTEESKECKELELHNAVDVKDETQVELPDLLSIKPRKGSITEFSDLSSPQNRFMLLGGMEKYFRTMSQFKVVPNIKLFTNLLICIPSTKEAEEELMKYVRKYKTKMDCAFLNCLIQRRLSRENETTMEECLEFMVKKNIKPDIITFGTFAKFCKTHEEGKKCLELVKAHDIRPNCQLMMSLLINAEKTLDLNYVSDILATVKQDNVEIDALFLSRVKKITAKVAKEKLRRSNQNNNHVESKSVT